MEVKLIVVLIALTLMVNLVVADFLFNHPSPKANELDREAGYICVPGRTIIKVTEKKPQIDVDVQSDSDEYRLRVGPNREEPSLMKSARRSHMTAPTEDESCQMCVCSTEGKDEYCSNRPAANLNECLMMKRITEKFNMGLPYEHTRSLSNRIRRGLSWWCRCQYNGNYYIFHNDEIPYNSKSKCFRGHSYYTNSLTANDTDIDVGTDVESLLDYDNENTCYYCICSASGAEVGCIAREVAFCNFFRVIRSDKHIRDRYTSLMQQDRPAYFRQLSYRLRRTMDHSIFEMLDAGGDTLCCNHPNGHRRQIHNQVRSKLRSIMRRVPKENLLGQKEAMKGDYVDFVVNNDKKKLNNEELSRRKCVPLVSEYTDCNEVSVCTGCSRCKCDASGQWECQDVQECHDEDKKSSDFDDLEQGDIFDDALQMLESDVEKKKLQSANKYVPPPRKLTEQEGLLAQFQDKGTDAMIASLRLSRHRRSTDVKTNKHTKRSVVKPSQTDKVSTHNNTVKNYDVIDEINEDMLKDSNLTGTLVAKKIDMIQPLTGSRRSSFADKSKALLTDNSQPKAIDHITDNKIEATETEIKFDASHENLKTVLGNFTQTDKNAYLSKIVVSELKKKNETIGDTSTIPLSFITFTPENDTLTAMAFIAGHLLNKLWNMEKDVAATSTETDGLKQEKIADLLELFKEPLNMRQELFLKNALEQLSNAIDKNKDTKNISICETINESQKLLHNRSDSNEEVTKELSRKNAKREENKAINVIEQKKAKIEMKINRKEATIKAMAKINNVLDLIKKFEYIQSNISELQHGPKFVFNHMFSNNRTHEFDTNLTEDEKNSFNLFGNLLEKITKLILPKRNNKKIANGIKNQNFLKDDDNLKKKLMKMYNVDITNMSMSAKDKMILDYLTHVNNKPDCVLNNKNYEAETLPSVEGNILLNLSEFFKLKSFSDLIKLIAPEKAITRESPIQTEKQTIETTTKVIDENNMPSSTKGVDSYKLSSTKEKLKAHLKTIMEDLVEMQSARGVNFKDNIKVTDALPCIYNLLKDGTEIEKKEENIDPVKKIANIFQGLKKEMKTSLSRRNAGDVMTERPKSAIVLERVVKNLSDKSHLNTRRSSKSEIPKSYDQIKRMMEQIENGSSMYKRHALIVKTPAAGKLILLKALELDVQAAINVIREITRSFDKLTKLPTEQFNELEEFVGNLATSINLSEKVIEKVKLDVIKLPGKTESQPQKGWEMLMAEMNNNNMLKTNFNKKPVLTASDPRGESDVKVSRIQIMNQLIRNRMKIFLKLKEENGSDVKHDMTYNIAQRILYYLDAGNYNLANELFGFFVLQKQNEPANGHVAPSTMKPMRRMAKPPKESAVLLEDPNKLKAKHVNWATQDHLIKQLLNIKNMGL